MTTATISKDFTFSASHRLAGLADDHPCSRLHGHNYTVRLELTGHTDHVGFVLDYRELAFFKELLDDTLDHRDLNDVLGDDFNPTAEHLAHWLLDITMAQLEAYQRDALDRLTAVRVSVSETPKTWATATTTRPVDFPVPESVVDRRDRHWPMPGLDPHELDSDRFRWGGGKR